MSILNDQHAEHYAALGKCVVAFSEIENSINILIHLILYDQADRHSAEKVDNTNILTSRMGGQDRLNIARTLVNERLGETAQAAFHPLFVELGTANTTRNTLLHSFWIEGLEHLSSVKHKVGKYFDSSPVTRDPQSLVDIASDFERLSEEVWEFMNQYAR